MVDEGLQGGRDDGLTTFKVGGQWDGEGSRSVMVLGGDRALQYS